MKHVCHETKFAMEAMIKLVPYSAFIQHVSIKHILKENCFILIL